jgi:hypothetical protein
MLWPTAHKGRKTPDTNNARENLKILKSESNVDDSCSAKLSPNENERKMSSFAGQPHVELLRIQNSPAGSDSDRGFSSNHETSQGSHAGPV